MKSPNVWPLRCTPLMILAMAVAAGCGAPDPLEPIREQQAAGDFAGSLEPIRALLDEDRSDPELQYRYGYALVATGQASLAEWALREAMRDPEWLVPAGLQLGTASLHASNFALAIETADRILAAHPDNPEALLMRANAHAHSRLDPEAALADANQLLELDPDNLEALEPRILALLSLDRAEEAGETIDQLGRRIQETGLQEGLPGWHCATTAIFADDSGDPELARERWEKCLALYPGHSNVVSNASKFYDARGEHARSLEVLRGAQQADPNSRLYRVTLAARLRAIHETDEAEQLLRQATQSGPAELVATAQIDLAKHFQELERYEEAARAVDRAVELMRTVSDPQPGLLLEQADARLLAGEFDAALAIADQMTLPGHRAMIRARVAQDRGQHAEALEHFDEAFRLWPDNPWARYQAALAAEAIGDFDRALEEYRYAIRIAAGETDARSRAARLLIADRQPARALMLLDVEAQTAPLDSEGMLLSARAAAWTGQPARVDYSLERARRLPGALGPTVASAAQGTHDFAGPTAAVQALRGWESQGIVDFTQLDHADALRSLVRFSSEPDQRDRAESDVRSALRTHPSASVLREILGLALELREAPADEVRAAYERAVELAAGNVTALTALARLKAHSNPAQALALCERAATAAPNDASVQREVGEILLALGRSELAEQRLEAALASDPYDGLAAGQLADIQLTRGSTGDRTLELARRAVRFHPTAEAYELLRRVHELREEHDAAQRAAERAKALQEHAFLQKRNESARPPSSVSQCCSGRLRKISQLPDLYRESISAAIR